MQILTPLYWKDYELIDSGGFEKLERFGVYLVRRPEPQALWDKSLSNNEWTSAHASFIRGKVNQQDENERGEWKLIHGMPEQWYIKYIYNDMELRLRLGLTSFKHVGVFPEQAENWNFIYDNVKKIGDGASVLNLFAYTGGASLAARAAGAKVTHVDSVKQVINWANENMTASKLTDIRWVVEDAMKFVQREVKRGNRYEGIILDPPAYGRGPDGQKWILGEQINSLMKMCGQLLNPHKRFMVLNLYSMGFSALIAQNLLASAMKIDNIESGELYFSDKEKRKLPLGVFARFSQNG